jgi:hypothetical protein
MLKVPLIWFLISLIDYSDLQQKGERQYKEVQNIFKFLNKEKLY